MGPVSPVHCCRGVHLHRCGQFLPKALVQFAGSCREAPYGLDRRACGPIVTGEYEPVPPSGGRPPSRRVLVAMSVVPLAGPAGRGNDAGSTEISRSPLSLLKDARDALSRVGCYHVRSSRSLPRSHRPSATKGTNGPSRGHAAQVGRQNPEVLHARTRHRRALVDPLKIDTCSPQVPGRVRASALVPQVRLPGDRRQEPHRTDFDLDVRQVCQIPSVSVDAQATLM